MDGRTDGWTDGRTDGRTDGLDGLTNISIIISNFSVAGIGKSFLA